MIILLHSSKTMRPPAEHLNSLQQPQLMPKSLQLANYLKTLTPQQLEKIMAISLKLAVTTQQLLISWTDSPRQLRPAIDSFLGDIYSGLQVNGFTLADRSYANKQLRILSGLYGILRPLDAIYPYRLEMGYKLPAQAIRNLYAFWGAAIAETLPPSVPIINLAAFEYSKVVTKFVARDRVITPKFLTLSPKTGQPTFVTVHAKIARGAFAHWLITERISEPRQLLDFTELGYAYHPELSENLQPVFVCKTFGGLGLSVRLQ